jgi:hypothetical protein
VRVLSKIVPAVTDERWQPAQRNRPSPTPTRSPDSVDQRTSRLSHRCSGASPASPPARSAGLRS